MKLKNKKNFPALFVMYFLWVLKYISTLHNKPIKWGFVLKSRAPNLRFLEDVNLAKDKTNTYSIN